MSGAVKGFWPSPEIVLRDFQVILLWPVRIEPKPNGELEKARTSGTQSAGEWLGQYAEWIQANGAWQVIRDYYSDAGRQAAVAEEDRYAEFSYFHPYIQRLFYGGYADGPQADPRAKPPVAILKRMDIRGARVVLKRQGPKWRFDVERVNLFLFPTDVALAVIQMGGPVSEEEEKPSSPFSLADGLDFLDWVRRVYPPYFKADGTSGGVPIKVEWLGEKDARIGDASDFECTVSYRRTVRERRVTPVAAHWKSILCPLVPASDGLGDGQDGLRYAQVEDDRIPVLAYVATDYPEAISAPDWERLAYCDSSDDSGRSFYSPKFLDRPDQEFGYERFWEPEKGYTTRYLCTSYSFVAAGKVDGFFNVYVRRHMEQQYLLLALLAHLQKSSLLGFWKRLSDMVHEFEAKPICAESQSELRRQKKWLLQDLTDFVSRFYFIEVSNQLQALELFDLMSKKLRTAQLMKEVIEQAEFVSKVLQEEWQEEVTTNQAKLEGMQAELSDQQARLTAVANKWLPAAVAASILGFSFALPQIDGLLQEFGWPKGKALAAGVIVAALVFLLLLKLLSSISERIMAKATANDPREGGR